MRLFYIKKHKWKIKPEVVWSGKALVEFQWYRMHHTELYIAAPVKVLSVEQGRNKGHLQGEHQHLTIL